MLIVTQQKSEIINLDRVEAVLIESEVACFNPGWIVFARGTSGKSMVLGRYKDRARAQDVLREIFTEYRILEKPAYEMPET